MSGRLSDSSQSFEAAVTSKFTVNDRFMLPDGEMEFRVVYGPDSREKFVQLCAELGPAGFVPSLQGSPEDCSLIVRKRQEPKPVQSRIPVLLILLTLTSVIITSLLFETVVYARYAPSVPGYAVFLGYVASMVAILGAFELGQRFVARREGMTPTTPYFIPGIPPLTAFLPSIGVISSQREPAVNRDSLYKVYLAGPIVALLVTVLLYAVSEFASAVSVVPMVGSQAANSNVTLINSNVVQVAIDSLAAPFTSQPPAGFLRLSPLADAATVGFLVVMINLLPMAVFNGGRIASTLFGQTVARIGTYASFLLLILVDTPNYWAIAIIVLLVGGRPPSTLVLDEVSGVSGSKKLIYLLMLLVALLCLPVPQSLGTLPLG